MAKLNISDIEMIDTLPSLEGSVALLTGRKPLNSLNARKIANPFRRESHCPKRASRRSVLSIKALIASISSIDEADAYDLIEAALSTTVLPN